MNALPAPIHQHCYRWFIIDGQVKKVGFRALFSEGEDGNYYLGARN